MVEATLPEVFLNLGEQAEQHYVPAAFTVEPAEPGVRRLRRAVVQVAATGPRRLSPELSWQCELFERASNERIPAGVTGRREHGVGPRQRADASPAR